MDEELGTWDFEPGQAFRVKKGTDLLRRDEFFEQVLLKMKMHNGKRAGWDETVWRQRVAREFDEFVKHRLYAGQLREARDDWQKVEAVAAQLLMEHPDLIGIYNVGAGTRGIVSALDAAGRQKTVVYIAHELTEQSRRALVDGSIDAIISQDPGHEVRSAIRVLMAKADNAPIVEAMERIRIDIFVRDNLP